jgi:signal transduction histidine kinase
MNTFDAYQKRIMIAFAVMSALAAVIAIVAFFLLTMVIRQKDRLLSEHVQAVIDAHKISDIAEHKVASGRAYLLTRDEEYLTKEEAVRAEFHRVLSKLASEDPSSLQTIRDAENEHEQAMKEAISLKQENKSAREIGRFFEERVQPHRMKLQQLIDHYIAVKENTLSLALSQASSTDDLAQWLLGFSAVGSVALSVLLFLVIVRVARQFRRADEERSRLLKETQDALSARDEFLSIASHELKTPLTSLDLNLQLLDRSLASLPSAERARRSAGASLAMSKRITQMIDELLDLTRIRAGKLILHREPVDLSVLVRDVAGRFQGPLQVRGESPLAGQWDPLRMEQVVTNLLSNALKYGDGKPVLISLQRGEGLARITVQDQGIGIPENEQERIFERFERSSTVKGIKGLGLGLYITRQIVEAHGGQIRVTSRPGRDRRSSSSSPWTRTGTQRARWPSTP